MNLPISSKTVKLPLAVNNFSYTYLSQKALQKPSYFSTEKIDASYEKIKKERYSNDILTFNPIFYKEDIFSDLPKNSKPYPQTLDIWNRIELF